MKRLPHSSLRPPLERHHGAHRRALIARHALRAAAGSAAAIAIAVAGGVAIATGVAGAWVRLLAVLAASAAVMVLAVMRFRRADLGLDSWLERVEGAFPVLRSWLRNAFDLERPPDHTSAELSRALTAETAQRVAGLPLHTLRPPLEPRRPALAIAGALTLIVAVGLLWPGRASRSWATLWNPNTAAPPVRLEVEPGSVTVTPGASLAVRARVWGTERAPRIARERDQTIAAVAEGRDPNGAHLWRFDLAQLTREQWYQVRVAATVSPRYQIGLAGEPAPVSFEIEYRSPAYARLPVQRGAAARGDLTGLRGSRAQVLVTFDRDLSGLDAGLPDGRTMAWKARTPRRWEGVVPLDREGEYELRAVARRAEGVPAGEGRFRYRITPLADAPPVLAVQLPQGDVDLPVGQRIPLEVLAQDDLGLSELKLQVRKDPAAPWTDLPLARFGARPREARIQTTWDASGLALLPGETAVFRFELFDDNAVSGRGQAVSPSFELRFPSLSELYDRVDDRQADAQQTLEKVAEQARELHKSLDKLARQQPRADAQASPRGFERREELKSSLERQQEITQRIEEATEQMRQSLDQAAERRAFDEQLMSKMREVHELMQQIQSSELKEAMRRMQEALERMDPRALEQQLPTLRQEQQEMISNLERTVELLKKLREEEKIESLAARARELKEQQDQLNREHQSGAEKREQRDAERRQAEARALAEQQRRAAEESEQLAKEARETAQGSEEQQTKQALEQSAEEMAEEAAPSQREAAQSTEQGQKSQAGKSGQQASQALERAANRLSRMAQQMQQEQNQLDLAAVRRAAQDLVSLQRSAEQNLGSSGSPDQRADRQTDLSEGTSRVADSLFTLSQQTPFLGPKLAEALGRAIQNLQQSGRELGTGNRERGEEAGRLGAQSLNEAVLELRNAEGAMCPNPGQGMPGGRKPNPQKIGEVGERQSLLNRQTRSIAQRLTEQMRLGAADRQELQRLADEQARIREQLEQIRRDDESRRELLGKLDQAEREMKQVEEILKSGRTDGDLEDKQTRIMSRLLDAQRSINRRDFDPERESRPGTDVARRSPAELPQELLRENDRLRLDLLKSEADRYPAHYRVFVEAYLRTLNGSRR
jgi:hypothetical protein